MSETEFPIPDRQTPAAAFKPAQQDGVLVLNKPKGLSSARCTALIKSRLGQKKIGHGGTLDPMATGVLLVLLGQATKLSGHLMDAGEKIYSGEIRLGLVTDTWDAEGTVLEEHPLPPLLPQDIEQAMAAFVGSHEQQVPPYSAAKHEGRALYKLARKGIDAPVKKKIVTVSRCEAELVGPGRIRFRVACASGTYIRSLAHSLGKRLGCGGMLAELTREYSHPFAIDRAHPLDELLDDPEGFASKTASIAEALPGWPRIILDGDEAQRVRNGMALTLDQARIPASAAAPAAAPAAKIGGQGDGRALFLDADARALALARAVPDKDRQGAFVWRVERGLWNL